MNLGTHLKYLALEARLITQAPGQWKTWRTTRNKYIEAGHDYCELCGSEKHLQVHHIIPRHVDPDKALDWDNLITFCRECHFRFGHFLYWQRYNANIVEMVNHRHYWNSYKINDIKELRCPFCGAEFISQTKCENGHTFEVYNKGLEKPDNKVDKIIKTIKWKVHV